MYIADILTITLLSLFVILAVIVCIDLYRLKRTYMNSARRTGKREKAFKIVTWVFASIFVGIAGYLFIVPANAQEGSPETYIWNDFSKPFEIVFDKPVKKDTSAFGFSQPVTGRWRFEKANALDIFNRKLVFYPEESLMPDEELYFTFRSQPMVAGLFEHDIKVTLSTGSKIPEVKVNDELSDRQNVDPEQELELTLEEGDHNSYLVSVESGPVNMFDSEETYSFRPATGPIPHEPFSNGELYELKIYITPVTYHLATKKPVRKGEKVLAKTVSFQTAHTPVIKEALPKGDSVLSTEQIHISFDQEMNKASVEKEFRIEPQIEGKFEWDNDSGRITFIPLESLKKDIESTITIGPDSRSAFGAKLGEPFSHKFRTAGSVGIERTSPTSGSHNIKVDTKINITFNQAVDKTSAESKINLSPKLNGTFSWKDNTVTFTPLTSLAYAQRYTVTVRAGIRSMDGTLLRSNYTFSFTTESKTVILKAPVINQPAQFACNVTAAAIALQFKGVNISPWDVYNGIPKESAPNTGSTWGNPNLGYVGNIHGVWGGDKSAGYGVHWGPIKNYISKHRPAETKQGWDLTELLREIDKGNPSIVWWQNGSASPTRLSWSTPDGAEINTFNGMHSEVVIGYIGSPENPSQIVLSDPWASRWGNKYRYMNANQFRAMWKTYFNNTAIVVR